jgi:SOS-response transcriptional repressor LexA
MKGLTQGQRRLLDFIVDYMAKNGIAPSFSDMSSGLNLKSKARVHDMITALRERGYIDYSPKRARSLTVLFYEEGNPHWENIARTLYLQNRILREFVSSRGWEADLAAMELPSEIQAAP